MTRQTQPRGGEQKIAVDLNNPEFLKSWFALRDKNEIARVLNTVEKLMQLTWGQVYRDPGLKWERITHPPVPLPPGIDALYSIRITHERGKTAPLLPTTRPGALDLLSLGDPRHDLAGDSGAVFRLHQHAVPA